MQICGLVNGRGGQQPSEWKHMAVRIWDAPFALICSL